MRETWAQKTARYKKRQAGFKPGKTIGKRVKRLEDGVEYKFRDIDSGTLQPDIAGVVTLVNGIAQGQDTDDRDGDQVLFTSIQIKLLARAHTAGDHSLIRVMLVQDRQCNGTALTPTLVLSKVTEFAIINAPLKLTNKFRFRVLMDRYIEVNDNGHDSAILSKYIKLNVKTRYTGATNGIASITTNSIFAIIIGSVALGDYNWITRVRFVDS